MTDVLPFCGDRGWQVSGVGQVYPKGQLPQAFIRVVSDGYFEAAGIPLAIGQRNYRSGPGIERKRGGSESDAGADLVAGPGALGQMMTTDGGRKVVGVVADVRHDALERRAGSEMYLPMRQTWDYSAMELVVRTALPPDGLAAGIRDGSPAHRPESARPRV